MIDIKIEGISIDLFPNTTIKLVLNGPLFNTDLIIEGDYTLAFSLPWSDKNKKFFKFIEVISNTKDFYAEKPCELYFAGSLLFPGTIQVNRAKSGKYFAKLASLPIDLKNNLKDKSLKDLYLGGKRLINTGVLRPEDMLHHAKDTRNGTYKTFDYVFFPVYNPDAYGNENQYWGQFINDYTASSFTRNQEMYYNRFRNTLIPFPYLIYVFDQLFSEHNYSSKGSFWKDDEIKTLVIYNNFSLDELSYVFNGTTLATPGNYFKRHITISDHVPDIKLQDFLIKLKKLFFLAYIFDHNARTVETIALKEIIQDTDYDDWTNITPPFYEISQEKDEGFKIVYKHESSDELIKTRFKSLELVNIVDSVDTFWDLPPSTSFNINDVILIKSLNMYYKVKSAGGWEFYRENLNDFTVGDGEKNIEVQISFLLEIVKNYGPDDYRNSLNPTIRHKIFTDIFDITGDTIGLILLFYRGVQMSDYNHYYDDAAQGVYFHIRPFGSYHNYNYEEEKIADYSLTYDGEFGIYETWGKDWINFLRNTKTVKKKILLDSFKLSQFIVNKKKWLRKIRIKGTNFFVKDISVTLKMDGITPADVTLYKIP